MNWNIKSELAALRLPPEVTSDLPLPEAVAEFEVIQVRDWYRAGSEIYAYVFDVVAADKRLTLIAKALVAPLVGTPPEKQLERWMRRRSQLAAAGVPVPRLLGIGKGLFVEEFIGFSLAEVAASLPRAEEKYRDLVAKVIEGGFSPQQFVSNIRSDGASLFWTDFGEDLGGSSAQSSLIPERLLGRALEEYAALNQHSTISYN